MEVTAKIEDAMFSRERRVGYDPDILHRATILVVGGGAIGQNVLLNLALSGVGELRIVDHDHFEAHNRTRSPLYPVENQELIGTAGKARWEAERLVTLMTAPQATVRYAEHLIQDLGDGAFAGVDFVLSCVDNARGRAWLADKTRLHGKPFIEAGFDGPELTLSCYPATSSMDEARQAPCWRCAHPGIEGAFPCRGVALRAEAQGVLPAIQNGAAAIAALQAEAAIQVLHGEAFLANQRLMLNLRTGQARTFNLALDPKCPGFHRMVIDGPKLLDADGNSTLRELLSEVSTEVAGAEEIVLPQPLIWEAPCDSCGSWVRVGEPEWRWMLRPTCGSCDQGRREDNDLRDRPSATAAAHIDARLPAEILDMSCSQAGLPSMSLVEVVGSGGVTQWLQLSGSLDDLFTTVS